ncbi:MAG: hypothetical protein FJ222_06450 [Lentisphaerae bacterium]|nr:hypothetical protein [Lentisphaerota bacterium]
MAKIGNQSVFIEQYDKVLAVVVLVSLLFSLLWLTSSQERRQQEEKAYQAALNALTPRPLEGTGFDMGVYSNALQQLVQPKQIALDAPDQGLFVPDRRVWCVRCSKPIPYAAEICPFCTEEQPKLAAPVPDTDGDGMFDIWERQYGFDPFDPNDADGDADGDGFTNVEEFLAKTDPREAQSHPPIDVLLRVKEVTAKRIELALRGKSRMPDGQVQCQFVQQGRSFFIREGEAISNDFYNTGFVFVAFTENYEKRAHPTLGEVTVETSFATIKRLADEQMFRLQMNDEAFSETVAELVLPVDGSTYAVVAGGTFTLRNERYNVISVDSKTQTVVIESASTRKRLTLGR